MIFGVYSNDMDPTKENIISDIVSIQRKEGNRKFSIVKKKRPLHPKEPPFQQQKPSANSFSSSIHSQESFIESKGIVAEDNTKKKWKRYLFIGTGAYILILIGALAFLYSNEMIYPFSINPEKENRMMSLMNILQVKVRKLEQENKEISKEIKKLTTKNGILLKQVVAVKKQNKKLTREKDSFEKENNLIKERLKTAFKSLSYYKSDAFKKELINSSGGDVTTLKKSNQQLSLELSKANETINELRENKKGSGLEFEKLKEEVKHLNETIAQKEESLLKTKNNLALAKEKFKKEKAAMHYNLGYIYKEQKKYKEAIEEYTQSLKFKPDDADTFYNMAIIYDDFLNNNDLAIEYYKKYLKQNPDAEDADQVNEWIENADREG